MRTRKEEAHLHNFTRIWKRVLISVLTTTLVGEGSIERGIGIGIDGDVGVGWSGTITK